MFNLMGMKHEKCFVVNVHELITYHGMHHAFRRRKNLRLLINLPDKCNSFKTYRSMGVELKKHQDILISAMHELTTKTINKLDYIL